MDFHWGEYTYNLAGGSEIFLSEFLTILSASGEDGADKLAEIVANMGQIENVTFSNPELLKIEKQSSEQAENDWLLTSLAAFDTEEKLTIKLTNGEEIVVRVTDATPASYKYYVEQANNYGSNGASYDSLSEAIDSINERNYNVRLYIGENCTLSNSITFTNTRNTREITIIGNGHTITRGSGVTGDLITHNRTGALTIQGLTLDGANVNTTGSLLKMASTGALTLTNTTVTGHTVSAAGVCAVDASAYTNATTPKVYVSGKTNISGNTAAGKPANLSVNGTDRLYLQDNLTGGDSQAIGITTPKGKNEQFATRDANKTGYEKFINDADSTLIPELSTNALYWIGTTPAAWDPHMSDAVAKITDSDGNILLTKATHGYQYAVYNTFANATAGYSAELYQYSAENGFTAYSGAVNIEYLIDNITLAATQTYSRDGRDVTFKSASKDATDGYPYKGSNEKTKITFTNTANRFIFQGSGVEYAFENIIIDGSNKEAQEGALIKVGNRGGATYTPIVRLKNGAVLQNGRTNAHDQGGAIYVGPGGKVYMEAGSLIQNCYSVNGNNSSGGAIYLAEGELYCDGGIIKNCQSYQGAAVDLGGTTDGARSDKARIYLSGTPEIYQNTDANGVSMNVHLNYDSNEIIQVIGNMTADAKVAVSINADTTIYENHGKEGKPFGTIANGVDVDPSSFINDRDTSLSATISETNPNLLVWSYPLIVDVLDDYYIDGSVVATTKLLENKYFVDASFNGGTADFLTAFFQQHPVDFNKISNFARVSVLAHKAVDGVTYPAVENVTNLRFVVNGNFGGKRWEISTDNGANWSGLMGRRVQIHYNRECRENVKFKLTTDGTTAIPSATFKLERSYPGSGSYSLYTAGSGKGKTTSGGAEVKDSSVNGIYTTDENGSFMMNLPEGYYRLTETTSKANYQKLSNPITFHVIVNQVKDIEANAQVSPYQVDGVSKATWTMNDYATWNTDKYIGTLHAENPDAYPPVTVDVHIMQLNANGTLTNKDSEWRTVNHTIQLSGAISEANLREAAKNCIRDDARFELYGTTYKVKENASSYYLYGVSGGATVDITSSLNVSGEDILIDNDDTKSLASQDVYLVVARGLRLEGYKTDNGTDWTFIPGSRGEYWEDYFPQGMNEGKSLVKQNQYNLGEVATAYEQKLNFNHDGYLYAYAVLASDTSIVLDSVKTVATDMGWDSSLNANVKSYKWQYKVVGGNDFVDLGADDYVMMRYNPFPIKVPIYWVFVNGDALTVIPAEDFNWYGTSLNNVPHEAEVYDTNPYVLAKYGSGLSGNHWVMPYLGMDQTTDTETYPYQMFQDDGVTPDGTWHAKYKFSYFAVDEPLISNTGSLTRKYADTNAMYLQACNDGVQFANNAALQDAHTSFTCGLYVVYEGMPESNYICKIGTERFKTLRAAVKYATDHSLKNAEIEMLVDYTMPAEDTVTIPAEYNITITTADKTGDAGYVYTGSGDKATITRGFTPTEETDTRDKLFTVTGYQAKLTFTNITIDGDKANHTGYKGSLVYVNGDSSNSGTNVPAVVIGSGATLQNAKTSKDGGGAVFVDHGTVTVDVGGTIKDCEAVNGDGGAIFVQSSGGVVNISGSLSGNGAKNGGAIKTGKNVVVNINSTAVIKNNDASEKGGAIYTSGSVNMSGGSIEDNTAAEKGAGIYADRDGSISFSGSPVVYDNKVGGKQRNVEYSNKDTNTSINLSAPLGDGSKIGIYAPEGHYNAGEPFGTRGTITANLNKFINDRNDTLYGVKVGDDGLIYWSYFVARVSKDNGATWTYHEYLISDETDTQNGQTIRKGAFNQANSLTGSVIIETLLENHARYTLTSGFTFNKSGLTSLTLRTTQDAVFNPDGFRSTLTKGQKTTSMITVENAVSAFTVEELIADGNGVDGANSGDKRGSLFNLASASAIFRDCELKNAMLDGSNTTCGGAIFYKQAGGSMEVYGCAFSNCRTGNGEGFSQSNGGAIYMDTGSTLIVDQSLKSRSSFTDCYANRYGGAVDYEPNGGSMSVKHTDFVRCTASRESGGAVFSDANTNNSTSGYATEIEDCTFDTCTAKNGGAIVTNIDTNKATCKVGIKDCTFTSCTASSTGGAVCSNSSNASLEVSGGSFTSCTASSNGGAIYSGNALTVTGTDSNYVTFESCHSSGSGGAIYHKSGALSLDYVRFGKRNGTAVVKDDIYGTRGGAVYTASPAALHVNHSEFLGCKHTSDSNNNNGGAIYFDCAPTSVTVENSIFEECESNRWGGAICFEQDSGNISVIDCQFVNCKATNSNAGGAGAIYTETSGTITLTGDSFTGCYSTHNGGALYFGGGTANLTNVNIDGSGLSSGTSANASLGGAIYSGGNLTIQQTGTGTSSITNCSASNANGGAVNLASGKKVTFEGNVVIEGNKNTTSDTAHEHNVVLDQNNNTTINTSGTGLGADAHIGVYVTDANSAYTNHGAYGLPFGTAAKEYNEANLEGFTNDRDPSLFGVNAQDMGKSDTADRPLIFWGRYICKIEDSNATGGRQATGRTVYEHPFKTLNAALDYARNNTNPVMSASQNVAIQMLVDYEIPASDKVSLDESTDNITITTAQTSGGVYNFKPTFGATEGRTTDDSDKTAILNRKSGFTDDSLFQIDNASAKLTTTKIILDGRGISTAASGGIVHVEIGKLHAGSDTVMRNSVVNASGYSYNTPTGNGGAIFLSANGASAEEDGLLIDGHSILALTGDDDANKTQAKNADANAERGGGIYISNNATFIFRGGELIKCKASGNGGALYNNGTVTMEEKPGETTLIRGSFEYCSATNGGAIYNGSTGTINMAGGYIEHCMASGNGGGIYTTSTGAVAVGKGAINLHTDNAHPGVINNCSADDNGGGIYLAAGEFDMSGGEIVECSAANGGGLYMADNTTVKLDELTDVNTLLRGTIESCTATSNGGGIYVAKGSTLTMNGGGIEHCVATGNGGGIYNGGSFTMTNTGAQPGVIDDCHATNGGGIYLGRVSTDNDTSIIISITGGTIQNCYATANGGAIYDDSKATIGLNDVTINGHTDGGLDGTTKNAVQGGAIYLPQLDQDYTSSLTLTGCNLYNLTAAQGGAIYSNRRSLDPQTGAVITDPTTMIGCNINISGGEINGHTGAFANSTEANAGNGGVIYLGNGSVNINGTNIYNCTVSGSGNPGENLTAGSGGVLFNVGNGHPSNDRVSPTVTMTNVTINGHYNGYSADIPNAQNGGAIFMKMAILSMENCTLTNLSVEPGSSGGGKGAAIFGYTNGGGNTPSVITISGGHIENNTASGTGGGAINVVSGYKVSGGNNSALSSTVSFEGNAVVYNNRNNGQQANVVLDEDALAHKNGPETNNGVILTTANGLGTGAHIGVYVVGDDSTNPYQDHGQSTQPFGTVQGSDTSKQNLGGVREDGTLYGFTNDRSDQNDLENLLYGTKEGNEGDNLIYWSGSAGYRKVILRKVDGSDYTSLKGAKFNVYKGTATSPYVVKDKDKPDETLSLENLTSLDSGVFWIGTLPYGVYYLQETKAPDSITITKSDGSTETRSYTPKWFYLVVGDDTVAGSRDGVVMSIGYGDRAEAEKAYNFYKAGTGTASP